MTKVRKALPYLFAALVAFWAFNSHRAPLKVVHAQQTATPYDCLFTYTFVGATAQVGVPNSSTSKPCVSWRVTYTTTGFTNATVQFETSPDNSVWTAVPNNICSSTVQPPCVNDGANPLTPAAQGTAAIKAYGKYVRINVTGVTGSGSGTVVVYGNKGATASGGGGGGSNGTTPKSCAENPISASGASNPCTHNLGTHINFIWCTDASSGVLVDVGPTTPGTNSTPFGVAAPETLNCYATTGGIGQRGPSGPSGASGASGASGPSGPSGPSGATGPSGPSGPSGPTGVGATGPSGPTGAQGPSGPSGGPSGPTGPSGPSGSAGSGSTIDCINTSSPGSDAFTCTPTVLPSSYVTGSLVTFTTGRTNTGTGPTLNILGPSGYLGAKAIITKVGDTPTIGMLVPGYPTLLWYDGTRFIIEAEPWRPTYCLDNSSSTTAYACPYYGPPGVFSIYTGPPNTGYGTLIPFTPALTNTTTTPTLDFTGTGISGVTIELVAGSGTIPVGYLVGGHTYVLEYNAFLSLSVVSGGAQGPSGPTGPTGPSGGPSGPTGPSGPSGPSGPAGATGPSGPSGPSGAAGAAGATGPTGPSGPSGSVTFGVTIDNGGAVITTGQKGYIQLPWACTITQWSAMADQSGTASVEIDALTSSAPPAAPAVPVVTTNNISASAPVALSTAQTASGGASAISTWTNSRAQWDVISFYVLASPTPASITRLTVEVVCAR